MPKFMLTLTWIAAAALVAMGGCVFPESTRYIEQPLGVRALAVVPLVTPDGLSTAWRVRDDRFLTVSHAFDRGRPTGRLNDGRTYEVLDSGDGLSREWSVWDAVRPGHDIADDWACFRTNPLLELSGVPDKRSREAIPADVRRPADGTECWLVAYTGIDGLAERVHQRVRILPTPARVAFDPGQVWFQTLDGSAIRQGYSGAPLVVLDADGYAHAVAMCVGKRRWPHGDVGVAIVLPARIFNGSPK